MAERTDWPEVSCVVPARDDADALPRAVQSALTQGYPGPLSLVIAVGPSWDATAAVARSLAAADPRVRVVDNPAGTTPAGLNIAIAASTGDIVARVDARSVLPPGYLLRAVETLESTGAANVGGRQDPVASRPFGRAVAQAMQSRFGAGGARFHVGGSPGPVDTVYLGVFRRAVLQELGGFDESLVRNQDYELNYRIRQGGGVVYFDPQLRVQYEPRSSLPGLARQYFEYGTWKRVVLGRHPSSLRWRQAVPPVTVAANVASLVAMMAGRRRAAAVPGIYLLGTALATVMTYRRHRDVRAALRLPLVYSTMHHAWGLGFLLGRPGRR